MSEDNPEKRDLDRLKRLLDRASGLPEMAGGDYRARLIALINERDTACAEAKRLARSLAEAREVLGIDSPYPGSMREQEADNVCLDDEARALLAWGFLITGATGAADWTLAREKIGAMPQFSTIGEFDSWLVGLGESVPEDYQTGFDWELAAYWMPSFIATLGREQREDRIERARGLISEELPALEAGAPP